MEIRERASFIRKRMEYHRPERKAPGILPSGEESAWNTTVRRGKRMEYHRPETKCLPACLIDLMWFEIVYEVLTGLWLYHKRLAEA